jgi:hypothetical protein
MTAIYMDEADDITIGLSAGGEGSPLGIYSSIERVMTVWPSKYQVSENVGGHAIYVESNGDEFGISVGSPNGETLLRFSVDNQGRAILKLPPETVERERPVDWGDRLALALKEDYQDHYFGAPEKLRDGAYRIETTPGYAFDSRFWGAFRRFPFEIDDIIPMSNGMALTWRVKADDGGAS